jgi:hypothetical protein
MKKITTYIVSIFIVLMLIYLYQVHVHTIFDGNPDFGKYGYPIGKFDAYALGIVSILILILIITLPDVIIKPSTLVLTLYYYIAILPYFSLYSLGLVGENLYGIDLLSILIFYSIFKFFNQHDVGLIYVSNKVQDKIRLVTFSTVLATLFLVYIYFEYVNATLVTSYLDVYSQREVYAKSSFISRLIVSFLSFGIIPYLIYKHNNSKSIMLLLFILLCNGAVFYATGSKLVFTGVLLILFVSYVYRKGMKVHMIGIFISALLLLVLMLVLIVNDVAFLSIYVRRVLILPAQIFGFNYEFFTEYSYNYLSHYSYLIFDAPYDMSSSKVIGDQYFIEGKTNANSNIIPDAYANFGLFGVVFYSFVFVILFKFIDSLNVAFKYQLTPLFASIAISLTNSSLLAVYVYQVLPLVLFFYIIKRN